MSRGRTNGSQAQESSKQARANLSNYEYFPNLQPPSILGLSSLIIAAYPKSDRRRLVRSYRVQYVARETAYGTSCLSESRKVARNGRSERADTQRATITRWRLRAAAEAV